VNTKEKKKCTLVTTNPQSCVFELYPGINRGFIAEEVHMNICPG